MGNSKDGYFSHDELKGSILVQMKKSKMVQKDHPPIVEMELFNGLGSVDLRSAEFMYKELMQSKPGTWVVVFFRHGGMHGVVGKKMYCNKRTLTFSVDGKAKSIQMIWACTIESALAVRSYYSLMNKPWPDPPF